MYQITCRTVCGQEVSLFTRCRLDNYRVFELEGRKNRIACFKFQSAKNEDCQDVSSGVLKA